VTCVTMHRAQTGRITAQRWRDAPGARVRGGAGPMAGVPGGDSNTAGPPIGGVIIRPAHLPPGLPSLRAAR
jgi:hypothetical protein